MRLLFLVLSLAVMVIPAVASAHGGGCRKSSPPGQCSTWTTARVWFTAIEGAKRCAGGWTLLRARGATQRAPSPGALLFAHACRDFGTDRITPQYNFLPTAFVDIEDTANVVRAGVNLRFGLGR